MNTNAQSTAKPACMEIPALAPLGRNDFFSSQAGEAEKRYWHMARVTNEMSVHSASAGCLPDSQTFAGQFCADVMSRL